MSACSPQRFLPNSRNLFRTATLTPSSVLPVANQVERIPFRRRGTAQAVITGSFTGAEAQVIEVEIMDTDVDVARVSQPTHSGAGSGTVTGIVATGPQQTFTLECQSASIDGASAAATIEGATVKAAVEGTPGDGTTIAVDQSGLAFAETAFTLVTDLEAGQGSDASPLIGQAYDWNTVQIANGVIPTTAQRIAFADNPTQVYLNYKDFVDGEFAYYLIPSLTRTVPRGTAIQIVTGGRTVVVSKGATTETTAAALPGGVVTAFDFLNWVRTTSELLIVTTPVPNDRTPTGLAAREFSLRTDAHAEISSGTGSTFASGVEDVTVATNAGTQLVTLTCFANNAGDHPFARLGAERWQGKSSLLGDLGTIVTGVPFTESSGAFGLTVPVKLPIGYDGTPKGRFTETSRTYASSVTQAPICPVSLTLGSAAVDQVITMIYSAAPSGDCDCTGMPKARFSPRCLGVPTEGGDSMSYQTDTITRVKALRLWETETIRSLSTFGAATNSARQASAISNPADGYASSIPETAPASFPYFAQATASLRAIINDFEGVAAQIDPLTDGSPETLRTDGFTAWDVAVAELQADIAAELSSPPVVEDLLNIPSDRYAARLDYVLMCAGISALGGADADTITAGDGCWRDLKKARFWRVYGARGEYAPLFTNVPYVSCRTSASGGVFSTHEFGLKLNVKCEDDLQLDDRIEFTIAESGFGATYQVGDVLTLPIVAASPLTLAGGVNAAPTQTWTLHGSVTGPLPPYTFDPDAPVAYTYDAGGVTLDFLLNAGGIPAAKGDRFRWAIEGGHYRWRYVGGDWQDYSPPRPIPLATDTLADGLSIAFTTGAAASFVAGDVYKFRVRQPWAVSNTQSPNDDVFKWDGPDVEYAADFGAPQQIDLFAMLHGLPAGATITLWGGVAAADEWSEVITYRPDAVWQAMDRAPRYVRILITNAAGGWIQWPWAGEPLTTVVSADFTPVVNYLVNRASGDLQGGRYLGRGVGGDVVWEVLYDGDVGWSLDDESGLRAMFDELKRNDDEPFLFIPQVTRTADPVIFARLGSDQPRFEDASGLNRNDGGARRWTVTMPLAPVYR